MNQSTNARNQSIRRVTLAGLAANFLLFLIKFAAGYWGGSRAVLADAFHSLGDLVSDGAILVGLSMWTAPADEEHQYGHARIETVVSLGIGLLLFVTAGGILLDSLQSIAAEKVSAVSPVALAAALLSLFVKEGLFRWTRQRGRQLNSSSMMANAWHHRSDALSSLPAAAAAGAAVFVPQWQFIDAVGAVVVAVILFGSAGRISFSALNALIDRAADERTKDAIRELVGSVDGVKCMHALRTRTLGNGWAVDIHVRVDGRISVREGHKIAHRVSEVLRDSGPNIQDVIVHIEPDDNCREPKSS
ncbi:MAG: cation diffusion facilitator family transporter [Verrucomicrobiota bacterium]